MTFKIIHPKFSLCHHGEPINNYGDYGITIAATAAIIAKTFSFVITLCVAPTFDTTLQLCQQHTTSSLAASRDTKATPIRPSQSSHHGASRDVDGNNCSTKTGGTPLIARRWLRGRQLIATWCPLFLLLTNSHAHETSSGNDTTSSCGYLNEPTQQRAAPPWTPPWPPPSVTSDEQSMAGLDGDTATSTTKHKAEKYSLEGHHDRCPAENFRSESFKPSGIDSEVNSWDLLLSVPQNDRWSLLWLVVLEGIGDPSPTTNSRHRKEDAKIEVIHSQPHQKIEVKPASRRSDNQVTSIFTGNFAQGVLILSQSTLLHPSCFHLSSQYPLSSKMTRPSSRSPSSLLSATKASSARTRSSQCLKEKTTLGMDISETVTRDSAFNAPPTTDAAHPADVPVASHRATAGDVAGLRVSTVVAKASPSVEPSAGDDSIKALDIGTVTSASSSTTAGDSPAITAGGGVAPTAIAEPKPSLKPTGVTDLNVTAGDARFDALAQPDGAPSVASVIGTPYGEAKANIAREAGVDRPKITSAPTTATTQDAKDSVPSPSSLFTNPGLSVADSIAQATDALAAEALDATDGAFTTVADAIEADTFGSGMDATIEGPGRAKLTHKDSGTSPTTEPGLSLEFNQDGPEFNTMDEAGVSGHGFGLGTVTPRVIDST